MPGSTRREHRTITIIISIVPVTLSTLPAPPLSFFPLPCFPFPLSPRSLISAAPTIPHLCLSAVSYIFLSPQFLTSSSSRLRDSSLLHISAIPLIFLSPQFLTSSSSCLCNPLYLPVFPVHIRCLIYSLRRCRYCRHLTSPSKVDCHHCQCACRSDTDSNIYRKIAHHSSRAVLFEILLPQRCCLIIKIRCPLRCILIRECRLISSHRLSLCRGRRSCRGRCRRGCRRRSRLRGPGR